MFETFHPHFENYAYLDSELSKSDHTNFKFYDVKSSNSDNFRTVWSHFSWKLTSAVSFHSLFWKFGHHLHSLALITEWTRSVCVIEVAIWAVFKPFLIMSPHVFFCISWKTLITTNWFCISKKTQGGTSNASWATILLTMSWASFWKRQSISGFRV